MQKGHKEKYDKLLLDVINLHALTKILLALLDYNNFCSSKHVSLIHLAEVIEKETYDIYKQLDILCLKNSIYYIGLDD